MVQKKFNSIWFGVILCLVIVQIFYSLHLRNNYVGGMNIIFILSDKEPHTSYIILFYFSAWAIKRGYLTAKAGRPDVYRAANELMRMALDGRICLSMKPRGYLKDVEHWRASDDNKQLIVMIKDVEVVVKEKLEKLNMEQVDYDDDDDEEETDNFEHDVDSDSDKESGEKSSGGESMSKNPYALLGED